MSLEKIRAMADIAKQMESMKSSVIQENVKDRRQLRVEALYKIQNYFKDVVESLNGTCVSVNLPVHINTFNMDKDFSKNTYNLDILINRDGKVRFWEYASGASVTIDDFINKTETDFYRQYAGSIHWNDGYIQLIEQWTEIKPLLENAIEKALIDQMNKTQKELTDFKVSYEIVSDFKA